MRFLVSAAAVLVTFASFAVSASAATLNLTGALGSSIANGKDGDVVYSGNAAFGAVRFIANPGGSDLTWSEGSGLGIDCPRRNCLIDSPYQIDAPEVLTVQFERSLFLTSVDISQLSTTRFWFLHIDETGSILGDGMDINFDSDNATGGALTVNVNRWVSVIHLVPDRGERNDFSLARLRIDELRAAPPPAPGAPGGHPTNPIPEPSSVLLMIAGAGVLATQLRRFV